MLTAREPLTGAPTVQRSLIWGLRSPGSLLIGASILTSAPVVSPVPVPVSAVTLRAYHVNIVYNGFVRPLIGLDAERESERLSIPGIVEGMRGMPASRR